MGKIYLVTSTYYPKPSLRSRLAISTLNAASASHIQTIVVDEHSYQGFTNAVSAIPGVQLHSQHGEGMDAGRYEALDIAYKQSNHGDAIIWTEPEKVDFVKSARLVAKPILLGDANMVQPNRKSMDSYPPIQRLTESAARVALFDLTGRDWDYFFGPVAVDKTALRYLLDFDPQNMAIPFTRSDYTRTHITKLQILSDRNLKVAEVLVDYTHPREQTLAETGNWEWDLNRVQQLSNLLRATAIAAKRLELFK